MKKGISLVSLIVVIIIMIILGGIVVFTGLDLSETTTINAFALEILNIQEAVDEYSLRYDKYPANDEYILDTTTIYGGNLTQFEGETIEDNKINLKNVDLSILGINDTEFGKGKAEDVYVLSETTGRVYYIKGIMFEGVTYYTLSNELLTILDMKQNVTVTQKDIKVYDVVFTPTATKYTNLPIEVTIKLPMAATINEITTTEEKSISEETTQGLYKVVKINETSENKNGNYTIQVKYTLDGMAKTAEYAVTVFDNTPPTLTVTETVDKNIKTVSLDMADTESKIKYVKYAKEIVSDLTYFEDYGTLVTGNQFKIENDSYYTVCVVDNAGNVASYNNMPESWKASVADIVDGVPIPKGFTASPYKGENTKDEGLVIYELNENEYSIPYDETQYDSWTKRNQYVWVPVASEDFKTQFVRGNYEKATRSNVPGTGRWEIALDLNTNMPSSTQNEAFVTKETLQEAQAMYASVKKYEGFYVARYEAGVGTEEEQGDIPAKVYSMMGKVPNCGVSLKEVMNDDSGGAIQLSRSVSTSTQGVKSTLIYQVQWSAILRWWLDSKVVTSVGADAIYGNYLTTTIAKEDLNEGAKYCTFAYGPYKTITTEEKDGETAWFLTTGALKKAKVKNIYDMAGNFSERTMECNGEDKTYFYGGQGDTKNNGSTYVGGGPISAKSGGVGFRVSLYVK